MPNANLKPSNLDQTLNETGREPVNAGSFNYQLCKNELTLCSYKGQME